MSIRPAVTPACLGLLLLSSVARAGPRVVALGDLHGDLPQTERALRLAGVVDEQGRWSGGPTVLVQTGDVVDRGPDSKAILDLLRDLQSQAAEAGGRVELLLGNHEIMNLQGDWRYVHVGDVEAFGGLDARIAAFRRDGRIGQWLSSLQVVVQVGDAVFLHGGLHPRWAGLGLDGVNQAARSSLLGGPQEILGSDGPVWYRGYVEDPEDEACVALDRSLRELGARRMVVGHTTQRDGRIKVRCAGRLHAIDVGLSSAYGGNLAVWESNDGDARAIYPSGVVDLEDPSP